MGRRRERENWVWEEEMEMYGESDRCNIQGGKEKRGCGQEGDERR